MALSVVPLAAESLGVRSVATYVECGDTRVLIDPGASLGASRFGLPPAEEEWEALRRANDRITAYAARGDVVFVSHYHEDHFRYDPVALRGPDGLGEGPARMIMPRQARARADSGRRLEGRCRLDAAEGRRFETPGLRAPGLATAGPRARGHGLGYVVALTVTDRASGTRFVHASDVQGPLSPVAAAYLERERPTVLYLSGPPAYLEAQVGRAADRAGDRAAAADHRPHGLPRDPGPPRPARRAAIPSASGALWETGRVVTAAGFLGLADEPLEARRRSSGARDGSRRGWPR